jgi:hypothetical protein
MMIWKEMKDMHILMSIQRPPAEGNFCDEYVKAKELVIVEGYSQHIGYIDKGGRIANNYLIS